MPAEFFSVDPLNLAAIAGMALVTLVTRFAGYLAVGRFAVRGRLAAALESVPPAVLTSLVAPMAFATGPAETAAAALTILAAWKLPTLAAAAIGVGAVVALRATLG